MPTLVGMAVNGTDEMTAEMECTVSVLEETVVNFVQRLDRLEDAATEAQNDECTVSVLEESVGHFAQRLDRLEAAATKAQNAEASAKETQIEGAGSSNLWSLHLNGLRDVMMTASQVSDLSTQTEELVMLKLAAMESAMDAAMARVLCEVKEPCSPSSDADIPRTLIQELQDACERLRSENQSLADQLEESRYLAAEATATKEEALRDVATIVQNAKKEVAEEMALAHAIVEQAKREAAFSIEDAMRDAAQEVAEAQAAVRMAQAAARQEVEEAKLQLAEARYARWSPDTTVQAQGQVQIHQQQEHTARAVQQPQHGMRIMQELVRSEVDVRHRKAHQSVTNGFRTEPRPVPLRGQRPETSRLPKTCRNPLCSYLAHGDLNKSVFYCCLSCEGSTKGKTPQHGAACEHRQLVCQVCLDNSRLCD